MEEVPKLLLSDLRNDEISIPSAKEMVDLASITYVGTPQEEGDSLQTISTESPEEDGLPAKGVESECTKDVVTTKESEVYLGAIADEGTPQEMEVQTIPTESPGESGLPARDVEVECNIGIPSAKGTGVDLATITDVVTPLEGGLQAISTESPGEDLLPANDVELECTKDGEGIEPLSALDKLTFATEISSNPVIDVLNLPEESEINFVSPELNIEELKPDPPSQDHSFASLNGVENASVDRLLKNESISFNSPIKPDPPEFEKTVTEDHDDDNSEDPVLKDHDDESCHSDVRTTAHENRTASKVTEVLHESSDRNDVWFKCSANEQVSKSACIETSFPAEVSETAVNVPLAKLSSNEVVEIRESVTLSPQQISIMTDFENPDLLCKVPLEINISGHAANSNDDDSIYEEIVVDDDDEFIEYVDEILDEDAFTEETYDSQDQTDLRFIVNGNTSRSSVCEDRGLNGHNSKSSISDNSLTKRPVIKSATQKALEQDEARKKAEAEVARKNMEFRLARQNSFTRKDEAFRRQLEEEEAEHLRQEEEQEKRRISEQQRLARQRAEQALALIRQQEEEELRQRLYNDEVRRQAAEAAAHRIAAEEAARSKEKAEKIRRKAEEKEKQERDAKRKAMEEEVMLLKSKLAEAKQAAEEAKQKQIEEKLRLKAKVEAHRREKKRASINNLTESQTSFPVNEAEASNVREVVAPQSVDTTMSSTAPSFTDSGSKVYYSVEQLREQSVPGLDYKNREIYLHPDEFQKLFGMSMAEFNEHPKWKKTQMKRKLKLF